jgi:hypothetical protein
MEMKKLNYVIPFRFGDDIIHFDPYENQIICTTDLSQEMKKLFVEHIRKTFFPQATQEDDEKLKNIYEV